MKAELIIAIGFIMIVSSCAPQVPCPAYTTKNNQTVEADRSLGVRQIADSKRVIPATVVRKYTCDN